MANIQKNNRGFTLVELIVATAILGIVALSACSFMVAGTRAYSSLNYTVRLQQESQLIMTQLEECAVDCTSGMAWDGSTLYIADGSTVHVFAYAAADKAIRYSSCPTAETLTIPAGDLMAEHVSGMSVSFADKKVHIALDMERSGKTYHATQVIALRNQPETAASWSELHDKL